jgi:hypothetical protein
VEDNVQEALINADIIVLVSEVAQSLEFVHKKAYP